MSPKNVVVAGRVEASADCDAAGLDGVVGVGVVCAPAAVLTPSGDPWNQAVFAAPMITLYLLSIGIAWIVNPQSKAKQTIG